MEYIIACAVAFVTALAVGRPVIKLLHKANFGQEIREEGPSWHQKKRGTPTMGGFIFFLGILVSAILVLIFTGVEPVQLSPLVCAALFGVIGFTDDYIKVIKHRNLGLSAGKKFLAQLLVSAAFAVFLYSYGPGTSVLIPFTAVSVNLSYFFIPFVVLVMLAVSNAVNLTDGIDGLAGTASAITMLFFAVAAYVFEFDTLAITLIAAVGAVVGFLIYNFHPASVFMGDTGSLFLGGLIGAAACFMGMELFIVMAGGVFLIETLSVILQVLYFKLTHGKRLFLMSPLHHHFEQKGWSEVKIVTVAGILTACLCVLSAFGMNIF